MLLLVRALAAAEALGLPASEVTTIMLDPLPDDVVRDMFGDRLLAEAMIRQAADSPFTVTEVAAALARQGAIVRDHDQRWRLRPACDASDIAEVVAAGLEEAARNRLAGLPARSRDMLGLLALLGRPAPAALLAAASGADLRAALDTLEGLTDAGLARARRQGWALSHELAGQAIRGAMSPAGMTRSHALLAGALRHCGADPVEIAGHLSASGDSEGAATAYVAAARSQLDRINDREAARLAEAGLSLDPPGRTRAALLEVRGEAGRRGAGWRRPVGTSPRRWTASTIRPAAPGSWPAWPSSTREPPVSPAAASLPSWRSRKLAGSPTRWDRRSRRVRSST